MAIPLRTIMHLANAVRIALLLAVAIVGYWGIDTQVNLHRDFAANASTTNATGAVKQVKTAPNATGDAAAIAEESQRLAQRANGILFALAAFGVVVFSLLGALFARRLSAPLWNTIQLAKKVAAGDLTVEFNQSSQDEAGQMMVALNQMVESLDTVVRKARRSSDEVAKSAAEITAGSNDLAARTEHQASTLEQTAASMEELSATTSNNLDQMRQAKTVAELAVSAAHESGVAVKNVIETMGRVDTSSKRIADIVGLIDGIAFQTNILALNAAVEAARAGDQGRGFAVVAQEVRQLAQKSASAAKEIKGLIAGSVAVVAESNELIVEAGNKMRNTVDRIRHLAELVNQTELASTEQVSGIQQVNQALSQLEDVTQQNAALVEQASAAAESQEQEAQYLVDLVRQFKLKDLPASIPAAQLSPRPVAETPVNRQWPPASASPARPAARAKIGAAPSKNKWPDDEEADWQEF